MLLYPTAALKFANESGSARTRQSRSSFLATLAQLQSSHPEQTVDRFTTGQLTSFCMRGNPSPNTVRARRTRLRTFFDWATWQKLVKANPASDLKFTVKAGTGGVKTHTWLEESDVAAIVRACPATMLGRRQKVVVLLGVFTGLRRFELAELEWSRFSHDMSTITLTGKGRKLATIGVPPQLRAELQSWKREAPVGARMVIPKWHTNRFNEGYWRWDEPVSEGTIESDVKAAGGRVGLKLAPHDLRRTFAGMLEAQGVALPDISRALRHSNMAVTSSYLEKNPRRTVAVTAGFRIAL